MPSCDVVDPSALPSTDGDADQVPSSESSPEDVPAAEHHPVAHAVPAQDVTAVLATAVPATDGQTSDGQAPGDKVSDDDASDAAVPTCAPSVPEAESEKDSVTADAPDIDAAKPVDPAAQERTED